MFYHHQELNDAFFAIADAQLLVLAKTLSLLSRKRLIKRLLNNQLAYGITCTEEQAERLFKKVDAIDVDADGVFISGSDRLDCPMVLDQMHQRLQSTYAEVATHATVQGIKTAKKTLKIAPPQDDIALFHWLLGLADEYAQSRYAEHEKFYYAHAGKTLIEFGMTQNLDALHKALMGRLVLKGNHPVTELHSILSHEFLNATWLIDGYPRDILIHDAMLLAQPHSYVRWDIKRDYCSTGLSTDPDGVRSVFVEEDFVFNISELSKQQLTA
jgi:hypothetical protein